MLGKEDTGMCEKCELEPETTIHILAKCPATSKLRREMFGDKILKRNELVQQPEQCKRILESRFEDLQE